MDNTHTSVYNGPMTDTDRTQSPRNLGRSDDPDYPFPDEPVGYVDEDAHTRRGDR